MGVVAVNLDRHLLAQLLPSGAAMVALGAALIVMHHHALADLRFLGVDRRADRDHHAAGFVPGDDGTVAHRDAAGLPLALGAAVLMQVAAAHAGRLHLDDDLVSVRHGIGEWHQFEFAFAVKHHTAHRFLRLLLLAGRYWTGKPDWQRANQSRSGGTNDKEFHFYPRAGEWMPPIAPRNGA